MLDYITHTICFTASFTYSSIMFLRFIHVKFVFNCFFVGLEIIPHLSIPLIFSICRIVIINTLTHILLVSINVDNFLG